MKKMAIILAAHPRNAGMFSVDRSAKELFGGGNTKFFSTNLYGGYYKSLISKGFGVSKYRDASQLNSFDTIVFWGDFLNNPLYAAGFAQSELQRGLVTSLNDGYSKWKELMMLSGFDSQNKKIVSVGNNFMSVDQGLFEGFSENDYRNELRKFQFIFPRDPVSARDIQRFTSESTEVDLGFDCAHLQKTPISSSFQSKNEFVYFFGRSNLTRTECLVRSLEAATGLRGVELSGWFDLNGVSRKSPFSFKWWRFNLLRERIMTARFVLTDVYHLSVNAINLRKPVFVVGIEESQDTPVSDFKKKVLFEHVGIRDFYIQAPSPDANEISHLVLEKVMSFNEVEHQYAVAIGEFENRLSNYRSRLFKALL